MHFIKFSYSETRGYSEESISDPLYAKLSMFLTENSGRDYTIYKDWALDPKNTCSYGNFVRIDKKNNSIVIWYELPDFSEQEIEEWPKEFPLSDLRQELVIPKKDFIHIIEEWVNFEHKLFSEIWIKNEGDIYWLEGVK